MKKMFFLLVLIELGIVFGDSSQSGNKKVFGTQSAHTLKRQVSMQIDYLLYVPEDYDSAQDEWPLLVFLHGLGERGPDINLLKKHGPPKLIEQGKQFPFIVLSPQCPANSWWTYEIAEVLALIDEICQTYKVDRKRIYLTGLSMGGYGTWAIAATNPDRFAAIAPICGGGFTFIAPNLKDIPVWAFHGADDRAVPLKKSQEMVDAVNRAGGKAKLTIYPKTKHDSWTRTYNNKKLYEWFLSHSK